MTGWLWALIAVYAVLAATAGAAVVFACREMRLLRAAIANLDAVTARLNSRYAGQ